MKKLGRLFLLLFVLQIVILSCNTLFAQKLKSSDVPADVTQTLEFQYPYVKVTGWVKDGSDYVASIKDEGTAGKVYISASGVWLRTTFNVPQAELPSTITDYVKANFPDFIISVSCLEEKENEKTRYYLEVKPDGVGQQPSVLTFSTTGKNELISRKDPANFKDPLAPVEKPAPKPVAAKEKETKPATPAKPAAPAKDTKPAASAKPAAPAKDNKDKDSKSTTTAKPVASAKPVTDKPVASAKPEAKKPEVKPKTEEPKPQKESKPEKPKKEKPEPVITDEQGNVALKPNAVPDLVTKALAKKIMHPEELNWFLIDSMYVAKCMNTGKKTACYITPQGVWEKTLTALTEESVTGPMLKHLNDYYKGWKFKSAMKEQRADKNDKTMVEFYEKANYKSKLVTVALFDKTGKLIRTIDPDYELGGGNKASGAEEEDLTKYYEKMNMSLESDDAKNVPENVAAVFKLKYPKVANVEWKEDENMNYQAVYYSARGKEICVINSYGEIVETMVMGKLDNLSTTIQDNIKKDHKGFKVVEYYSVKKIAEKLNLYKVLIQNKKTGEEDVLWFNLSGRPVEI